MTTRRSTDAALLVLAGALAWTACQPSGGDRHEPEAAAGDPATEEQLASLPYAAWVATRSGERSGVVRAEADRVAGGLNLYSTRSLPGARLFDLRGRVVHRWTGTAGAPGWHHVELLPGGDLIVLEKEGGLLRVGWDSRPRWSLAVRAHHDIAVADDGRILVPVWAERVVESPLGTYVGLDPQILVLSSDGEEIERLSLWRHFIDEVPAARVADAVRWTRRALAKGGSVDTLVVPMDAAGDLLHLNAVEILPRAIEGVAEAGDLLVMIREIDRVAILDSRLRTVKWSWGAGVLDGPHDPTPLADGRILVFDNGRERGASRVLEVDPRTDEAVWSYPAPGDPPFFSIGQGGAQRLANGNTLITESGRGRAFEITPENDVVWEFLSPDERWNRTLRSTQRASIYRLQRLSSAELRRLGVNEQLRSARP